jgi:hypothetical protein
MEDGSVKDDGAMNIISVSHVGIDRLRVELASATEMAFEIRFLASDNDYLKILAEVCAVIPSMLDYDAALMDAMDSPSTGRIPLAPVNVVKAFVRRYRTRITNISVALPPFEKL